MYYKIENKDCEVFKKLHELRTEELRIEKDNEKAIKERTGLDFITFLGQKGQQNFWRITRYTGFKFTEPDKVDMKIWARNKQHPEIFVPNLRTKAGREMKYFLNNDLESSDYTEVFEILQLPEVREFTFPFVEIAGELIIIFLGDNQESKNKNVIEITKREFQQIREAAINYKELFNADPKIILEDKK